MKKTLRVYANDKGQIVVPTLLREKYGIKNGTKIIVTDIGNAIVLKPVTEERLKLLQGSLKGTGALKVLMEERELEREK